MTDAGHRNVVDLHGCRRELALGGGWTCPWLLRLSDSTGYLSNDILPVVLTRGPRRLRKPHRRGELRAVVDETIALFHRLAWVAQEIYGAEGTSTARRGILRGLARYGPQTVPELARARSVRRQTLQPVVDALAKDGLVKLVANPRHARSRLVRITRAGSATVEDMDRVDERVLAAAGAGIPREDLTTTVMTLRALRTRFESSTRWRPVLEGR